MQAILWPIVSWIFKVAIVKFLLFAVIYYGLTEVAMSVLDMYDNCCIPDVDTMDYFFNVVITPQMWWILDAMNLSYGFTCVLAAMIAAFLVRRIPIVG